MKAKLQLIVNGLKTVFRLPSNIVIAAVFAFMGLFVAIWITNIPLLKEMVFGDTFSLTSKVDIIITSFGALESNFHAFSRTMTLLIVTLFGINFAMVIHYLRKRFVLDRSAGTSIIGTIFGMLGVGCASCGSILVTSLFGTALIGLLPFKGLEFGVIGVLILIYSIYLSSKKIMNPGVCEF